MERSDTWSFREGASDPSESPGTSERENSDRSIPRFNGDTSVRDFDFFYGKYFDGRPKGPQDTTLGEAVARAIMRARVDAETTFEEEQTQFGEPLAESTALNILENIKEEEDIFENIPERLHKQSNHRRWHTQSAVVPEGRDPKEDQRQGAIITRKDELRAIILELHFEGPDRCKEAAARTNWGKAMYRLAAEILKDAEKLQLLWPSKKEIYEHSPYFSRALGVTEKDQGRNIVKSVSIEERDTGVWPECQNKERAQEIEEKARLFSTINEDNYRRDYRLQHGRWIGDKLGTCSSHNPNPLQKHILANYVTKAEVAEKLSKDWEQYGYIDQKQSRRAIMETVLPITIPNLEEMPIFRLKTNPGEGFPMEKYRDYSEAGKWGRHTRPYYYFDTDETWFRTSQRGPRQVNIEETRPESELKDETFGAEEERRTYLKYTTSDEAWKTDIDPKAKQRVRLVYIFVSPRQSVSEAPWQCGSHLFNHCWGCWGNDCTECWFLYSAGSARWGPSSCSTCKKLEEFEDGGENEEWLWRTGSTTEDGIDNPDKTTIGWVMVYSKAHKYAPETFISKPRDYSGEKTGPIYEDISSDEDLEIFPELRVKSGYDLELVLDYSKIGG